MIPLHIAQQLADQVEALSEHVGIDAVDWVQVVRAIAAFEVAKAQPVRVTLPKVTRCIETWSDYRGEVIATLKAQGIEVAE